MLEHLANSKKVLYDKIHKLICISFKFRPKIITQNGNLIFEGANDRNISFVTKGRGVFKINDVDYKRLIRSFSYPSPNRSVLIYNQLSRSLTNIESKMLGPSGIIQRLEVLEGNW